MPISIRPPQATDYSQWAQLFTGYLAHCQSSLPDAQMQRTWARLLDPNGDIHALIAWDDAPAPAPASASSSETPAKDSGDSAPAPKMVGIAHYVFFATTWTEQSVACLSDLFVDPQARKQGIGRSLIVAVAKAAEDKGCRGLKWAMHDSNTAVQRLYDSLAVSEFREYRMRLPFDPQATGRRMLAE